MKTFKGFDKNMQCRVFQFEIGKTYRHEGNVKACSSGFHSCEYPLDIFAYYPPSDENQYAEVVAGGAIGTHYEDSKIASGEIQIVKLLSLSDLVAESVAATLSKITNTGDYSEATNTGYKSAATNTGDQSAATVSGNASIAVASGSRGKAKASKGSAIVLCAYDAEGNMTHCKSGIAGKGKIMADTFYTLDDSGKFVEVD